MIHSHLPAGFSKIMPAFRTTLQRVPYECAEPNGSLIYANGNLVSDFCVKCAALAQHKCNRTTPEKSAAKVFAYIKVQIEARDELVTELRQRRKIFEQDYHWCSVPRCENIAEPGRKTCAECGSKSAEATERAYRKQYPLHKCAGAGGKNCRNKTTRKYCRKCAGIRRSARYRKEKREGLR